MMMLVVASLFSLALLAMKLGGDLSFFWLSAWSRLGLFLVSSTVVLVFWRKLGMSVVFLKALVLRYLSWESGLVVLSYFDFTLIVLSFRYAGAHVVAVVYEMWPLLLIAVVTCFCGSRYRAMGTAGYLGCVVAMVGIYFAVSSGAGLEMDWVLHIFGGSSTFGVLVSLGLPLSAGFCTAFTGFSWVMYSKVARDEAVMSKNAGGAGGAAMLLVLLSVCNLGSFILFGLLGAIFEGVGGVVFDGWLVLVGLVICGGGYGVAAVLWRLSTVVTNNVGVHGVAYLTPVFTLLLFQWFGLLDEIDLALLWLGAGLVVTGNLGVMARGLWSRRGHVELA